METSNTWKKYNAMKTITIKITGKVSPGRENLQVLIAFKTPLISRPGVSKKVGSTKADGTFSGTIRQNILRLMPVPQTIPGTIIVNDTQGKEIYRRENHRFSTQSENNLRINLGHIHGIPNQPVPPQTTPRSPVPPQRSPRVPRDPRPTRITILISGKVMATPPDKITTTYKLEFFARINRKNLLIASANSDHGTGKYSISKVIPASEAQNFPKEITCSVKVSIGNKEVPGINPKQVRLTLGVNKGVNFTIPLQPYKVRLHFTDKDTGETFKDKLSVKISGRTQGRVIEIENGRIEQELHLGIGNQIRIEAEVIDRYEKKTSVYSGGIVPGLDNTKTISKKIPLSYPKYDELKTSLIRPVDMMLLEIEFNYLVIQRGQLKPAFKGKDGLMVVTFPPQAFAEEAFFEVDPNIPITNTADADYDPKCDPDSDVYDENYKKPLEDIKSLVHSRISGESRLAFKVKQDESIKFDQEALLQAMCDLELNICLPAKDTWQLILPPHIAGINDRLSSILGQLKASKKGLYHKVYFTEKHKGFLQNIVQIKPPLKSTGITPTNPKKEETSIEAPYRLIISPHQHSTWLHKTGAIVLDRNKPVELWHSKLIVKDDEKLHSNTIRAVWTLDPGFTKDVNNDNNDDKFTPKKDDNNTGKNPFRMSLDAFDRKNIVHLTSNHSIDNFNPLPVHVENLMLTALGAFMNVKGGWEPPGELSVEEWQHRASLGRDHFVKVVYKGYLFPFGHRASLVKITERKLTGGIEAIVTDSVKKVYQGTKDRAISGEYQKIAEEALLDLNDKKVKEIPTLIESFSKKANDLTKKKTGTIAHQNKIHIQLVDSFRDLIGGILSDPVLMKNSWVTILKQRKFIIVREEEKIYEKGDDAINRCWPFLRVEFKTLVTPNLDNPGDCDVNGEGRSMFWPHVGGSPFPFVIEAEDLQENLASFSAPVIFVENTNNNKSDLNNALDDYNNGTLGTIKNKIFLYGQSIRFAEASNDNTIFDTKTITFSAQIANADKQFGTHNPNFYPQIREAEVEIPALKVLLGENGIATINFFPTYLQHEFNKDNNKGQVFAEVTSAPVINFSNHGDKSGGIMQPNIKITGLSRLLGPVGGDLDDLAKGNFKPELYFAGSSAKIFGSIQLWDILEENIVFSSQDLEGIPLIETKINGENQKVSLDWKPRLKKWKKIFIPDSGADANISACKEDDNFSSESFIKKFTIKLLEPINFITIEFKTIESAQGSNKPKVVFDFENIDFEGCLKFIIKLLEFVNRRKALENEAEGDETVDNEIEETNAGNDESKLQFVLDVSPKGITTGFSKSIPDIEVGVLNLQNLSLAAAFSIPFSNDPLSLRFSFCEKHNPFMLTVSMFGGGGYFGIVLSPGGLLLMEAAFEFGAGIAMNFGVASGNVSIMAGIYFVMEKTEDEQFSVALTGYLRINGNVRVLGIVNASILLLMALEYHANSGKCVGRAVLIVEVSVLLFSASVEIACEKKFAGSEGDPTFEQIMEPYYDEMKQKNVKPWEDYCNAFAF